MKTLNRDGVALAYEEAGEGEPAFVFVPGGSCDWWCFHRQLEHFSASHRCVAIDPRGHGQSDKPDQDYTMVAWADDIAWMIDQLGMDRPIVVGHSMGGAISLQLAADHPGVMRALVLDDPAPVTDNSTGYDQILAAFDKRGVDTTRRHMFESFFLAERDETMVAELCDRAAAVPDHVFISEINGLRSWDGAAAARACSVPTLHIAAAHPVCPPKVLRRAIPDVVTGQTVGAGHFNMLEVPDQVNAMIDQFLHHYVS